MPSACATYRRGWILRAVWRARLRRRVGMDVLGRRRATQLPYHLIGDVAHAGSPQQLHGPDYPITLDFSQEFVFGQKGLEPMVHVAAALSSVCLGLVELCLAIAWSLGSMDGG